MGIFLWIPHFPMDKYFRFFRRGQKGLRRPNVLLFTFREQSPMIPLFFAEIVFDLRRADLRGAGKIDHLAAFLPKEVKAALPVVADDKGVDVVFMHVAALLFPVFLGDDQIDVPDGFEQRFALLVGEVAFLVLLVPVKFIGGQRHHQIIP